MSRQEEKSITLYDGKAYGHKVSDYALQNGYLDYLTLSNIVGDCVMNNNVFEYAGYENWALESGEEEDENGYFYDVFQYYIITDNGASFLERYTDEIVYYHEELDMYLWGITHFGTSWDYVLTDIKLNICLQN
jgi:hypothetical protein